MGTTARFALLPEPDHVALPRHLLAAAVLSWLAFAVYLAHVRIHDSIFTMPQRAFAQARLTELDGDWMSPIYSSNEDDDEKQYHTP